MCYGCEHGMGGDCWDDRPTPMRRLPNVDFDVHNPMAYWEVEETGMDREQAQVAKLFREHLNTERVQAEVSRRIKMMEDYGNDMFPDGCVLGFTRTFQESEKAYAYVALKADNKWYVTGKENVPTGMTWAEFVSWMVGHPTANPVPVTSVAVATKWANLTK